MKRKAVVGKFRTALLMTSVAVLAGGAIAITTHAASAAGAICEQYGSATVGKYIVQNNRWGTSATQCINVTDSGFQITQQDGTSATNGAPVSYPSIYYGCHYGNCSPGTSLPKQLSSIGSMQSSINYTYAGGTYDAAYDIWLDSTPKTTGVNQTEIMIWFNRQGSIQPIGSSTGSANVGGKTWDVWTGSNGQNNVVSYLAPSAISSWSFNVTDFTNDAVNRGGGYGNNSWYLTSVQAGFEPWNGGVGLAISGFSVN